MPALTNALSLNSTGDIIPNDLPPEIWDEIFNTSNPILAKYNYYIKRRIHSLPLTLPSSSSSPSSSSTTPALQHEYRIIQYLLSHRNDHNITHIHTHTDTDTRTSHPHHYPSFCYFQERDSLQCLVLPFYPEKYKILSIIRQSKQQYHHQPTLIHTIYHQLSLSLIHTLQCIHHTGVLHNDITPDHIYLLYDDMNDFINHFNKPNHHDLHCIFIDYDLAAINNITEHQPPSLQHDISSYTSQWQQYYHVPTSHQCCIYRGTLEYSSINNHLGVTPSYASDCESLIYVIVSTLFDISLPFINGTVHLDDDTCNDIIDDDDTSYMDMYHQYHYSDKKLQWLYGDDIGDDTIQLQQVKHRIQRVVASIYQVNERDICNDSMQKIVELLSNEDSANRVITNDELTCSVPHVTPESLMREYREFSGRWLDQCIENNRSNESSVALNCSIADLVANAAEMLPSVLGMQWDHMNDETQMSCINSILLIEYIDELTPEYCSIKQRQSNNIDILAIAIAKLESRLTDIMKRASSSYHATMCSQWKDIQCVIFLASSAASAPSTHSGARTRTSTSVNESHLANEWIRSNYTLCFPCIRVLTAFHRVWVYEVDKDSFTERSCTPSSTLSSTTNNPLDMLLQAME